MAYRDAHAVSVARVCGTVCRCARETSRCGARDRFDSRHVRHLFLLHAIRPLVVSAISLAGDRVDDGAGKRRTVHALTASLPRRCRRRRPRSSAAIAVGLAIFYVRSADDRLAFNLKFLEQRYRSAGIVVRDRLPECRGAVGMGQRRRALSRAERSAHVGRARSRVARSCLAWLESTATAVHHGRIVGRAGLPPPVWQPQRYRQTRLAPEIRNRSRRPHLRPEGPRAIRSRRARRHRISMAAAEGADPRCGAGRRAIAFPTDDVSRDAIDRLGFVQADPIRSPARAQDLILRQGSADIARAISSGSTRRSMSRRTICTRTDFFRSAHGTCCIRGRRRRSTRSKRRCLNRNQARRSASGSARSTPRQAPRRECVGRVFESDDSRARMAALERTVAHRATGNGIRVYKPPPSRPRQCHRPNGCAR